MEADSPVMQGVCTVRFDASIEQVQLRRATAREHFRRQPVVGIEQCSRFQRQA